MAAQHGVGIYPLQSAAAFDFGGCAYSERAIMLGFAALDEQQIRVGVERIAAAVEAAQRTAGRGRVSRTERMRPRSPANAIFRAAARPITG